MASDASVYTTDFAAEFPASEEDWRKAAEAALKGRPLDQILHGRTIDGVAFEAITPRREAKPIAGRTAGARWTAMTRIDIADPEAANAQALEDLNNGASGLSLVFAGAGQDGLEADTLERLDRTLDGVMLDLAPVHLDTPAFQGRQTAALFAALVERRGQDAGGVHALFGVDPLRSLAQAGATPAPIEALAKGAADMLETLRGRGFVSPVFASDQRLSHEAGASEAQELAAALATALEHVRTIGGAGAAPETVADAIALAFSVDADQFASIAKLRAARLLWAAFRRELGLADRPVHIHAETSRRMLTRYDAQTNMVRATIAAFAAGVAGADSVVTLPFTLALGGATADARRIARNTQSIVLEETNAYRVADPAAGAGAIEALTDALAAKAWEIFRDVEREGGMLKALTSGSWAKRIGETRAARAKGVANRKITVVGVSQFPKADEATVGVPAPSRPEPAAPAAPFEAKDFSAMVASFLAGAALPRGAEASVAALLTPGRVAEVFESLRAENEARSPRPAAFLALVGPVARHGGRAGFARNLLEAGGVAVIDGPVGEGPAEAAAAFRSAGAGLAVVCGADADYAEGAAELAGALASAGATVWLAGKPGDLEAALKSAGVERFLGAGDDAVEALKAASAVTGGA